jgi:hypothetical protein
MSLGKTVSRKERKGKTACYQALACDPNSLGFYLYKYLNFFAAFATLREIMPFLGL